MVIKKIIVYTRYTLLDKQINVHNLFATCIFFFFFFAVARIIIERLKKLYPINTYFSAIRFNLKWTCLKLINLV